MICVKKLGIAIVLTTLGASAASAVETTFSSTTPTAGAQTDAGTGLNGRVTNLLNVIVPGGFDWNSTSIRMTLTQGAVYNAAPPAGTDSAPSPPLYTVTGFRNGEFDTFVNSKNTTPATLLGTLNADRTSGPPPATGLTNDGATLVSAVWGNTANGEDGTFPVGRFTLSGDAVGSFFGFSGDSSQPGMLVPFSGTIANGTFVPEPGSLGLLAVGGLSLLRRKRRGA